MPFDGVALEKLTSWSYGNEKLAELEWLLRQPEDWPGWEWDFMHINDAADNNHCGTSGCAVGLAYAAGITQGWYDTLDFFDMSLVAYENIFFDNNIYGVGWDNVTPLMVADAIRKYMLSGEV